MSGTAIAAGPTITGSNIVDETVTSADVKNGTLTAADVASGTFLAADGKAADSSLLDGKSASAFLPATGTAADADKLDGKDATAFAGHPLQAKVQANGLDFGGEGFTVTKKNAGEYFIEGPAGTNLWSCVVLPVLGNGNGFANAAYSGSSTGWAPAGEIASYKAFDNYVDRQGVEVVTRDSTGTPTDLAFVLTAIC